MGSDLAEEYRSREERIVSRSDHELRNTTWISAGHECSRRLRVCHYSPRGLDPDGEWTEYPEDLHRREGSPEGGRSLGDVQRRLHWSLGRRHAGLRYRRAERLEREGHYSG